MVLEKHISLVVLTLIVGTSCLWLPDDESTQGRNSEVDQLSWINQGTKHVKPLPAQTEAEIASFRNREGWNTPPRWNAQQEFGSGWYGDDSDVVSAEFGDDTGVQTADLDNASDDVIWAREREEEKELELAAEDFQAGVNRLYYKDGVAGLPSVLDTTTIQMYPEYTHSNNHQQKEKSMTNTAGFTGRNLDIWDAQKSTPGTPFAQEEEVFFDYESRENTSNRRGSSTMAPHVTPQNVGIAIYMETNVTHFDQPQVTSHSLTTGTGEIDHPSHLLTDRKTSTLTTGSQKTTSSAAFSSVITEAPMKELSSQAGFMSTSPGYIVSYAPATDIECIDQCITFLHNISLTIDPVLAWTETGQSVNITCEASSSVTSQLDMTSLKLSWMFRALNEETCQLTKGVEAEDICNDTTGINEEYIVNGTFIQSRLSLLHTNSNSRGLYICVATASCCQGTAHAQKLHRDVNTQLFSFSRPSYEIHLAATCAALLGFLIALAVVALLRRRRRRKKSDNGPVVNCHYQPVRMLKLPDVAADSFTSQQGEKGNNENENSDSDFDDEFYDYRDRGEPSPSRVVHVNPLSEIMTSPLPQGITMTSFNQQELSGPRSSVLARLDSNPNSFG